MKFSKVLLLLPALASFVLAAEGEEKPDFEPKPKVKGIRTKEDCERGFNLLKNYYSEEIEKDPKCTYSEEYAKEHEFTGDYTMAKENRDYFCENCLTKYLKLGNPMANDCGENSPREMIFDLYFLSSVNAVVCSKDQLHNKYCEEVMDELFESESQKPIINWSENTLCNECPFIYHQLFKEREDFYNSVKKDSKEESFIGKLLPLRDIEPDCFKEFEHLKKQAKAEEMEKRKKEAKEKKNIKNMNDIMDDLHKEEEKKEKKEEVKTEKKASEAGEL